MKIADSVNSSKGVDISIQGQVFDIQRYSINDGPGIRTTVFFKGCPLECIWCDNPESQRLSPDLLYFESLCVRCYRCVEACPNQATRINTDGSISIDRELCTACGACVAVCLAEARAVSGSTMTVGKDVGHSQKGYPLLSKLGGRGYRLWWRSNLSTRIPFRAIERLPGIWNPYYY